ncbi:MAG: AMP-binding protein [Candidatus Nanopelagicales bacterium]
MLLIDDLARAAAEQPDAPGVSYDGRQWTWSQWHDRVRRLTGALVSAGLGRGDRVAVIDRNHVAILDVILAASSLGAATVVPNWRLKDDELTHIIQDSSPRLVLVGEAAAGRDDLILTAAPSIERVIPMSDYETWIDGAQPVDPTPEVTPDDVALVIYTSGTTGLAKGATFSHRGLQANSVISARLGAMGPDDRVLVSMPLFHVGGAGAALTAIHEAVPITLLRDANADSIVEAIESGCTRAFLVPAVISTLLHAGERERQALASLSLLTYGGAPCPRPLLQEALAVMPKTQFTQVYGMTETCGTVTALPDDVHRDRQRPERLASVGRAVDGVEVRVVDPSSLADLPEGSVGELWFRTPKRMTGYLGQPKATAQVIVEGDWVRTGDIGRMNADGFIVIEDRLKDIIITGGENVFSPEVESVLSDHPAVADVAVIGVPDPRMGEAVVAVVVPHDRATIDPDALIAYAHERLAGYKCPRRIDLVDALPRNASGKVLKRELREHLQAAG